MSVPNISPIVYVRTGSELASGTWLQEPDTAGPLLLVSPNAVPLIRGTERQMAEFKKEIERLTERIAAERWRVSQAQRLAPKLQKG